MGDLRTTFPFNFESIFCISGMNNKVYWNNNEKYFLLTRKIIRLLCYN